MISGEKGLAISERQRFCLTDSTKMCRRASIFVVVFHDHTVLFVSLHKFLENFCLRKFKLWRGK